MINKLKLLLVFLSLLLIQSCKKDDEQTPATPATGTTGNPAREAAVADYTTNYLGSEVTSTGWTGNVATCNAGRCSQATTNAVLKRINYFRRLVGLNDQCKMDTSFFQQEQEAALMQDANSQLSHNPPTTWSCYTSLGASGCGSSNLALGYTASSAITAFIKDEGSGNQVVGHRRWILHSRKQYFSYGSTNGAMALYVFRSDTNSVIPSFIAYPPKGYIPYTLVPSRWSLSIPNANFSGATVSMTNAAGTAVPVTIVSRTDNGYGDNTVVWTATGIDLSTTSDVAYNITVSGVSGAAQTSYSYTTTIFHP